MNTEMQTSASIPSSRRYRHASHYLSFSIFCVENQLYCLPKDHLSLHSEVFAGMFSIDNGTDGQSDDHPIVLEGYKSEDFDALLRIIVPKPLEPSPPYLNKDEWISVLKLSTIWQMDKIRKLAIEKLSIMNMLPLEKIVMAREYNVSKWLSEGASALVETLDTFKIEDIAQTIGWETTARIYAVHSAAQKSEFDQKLKETQAQTVQISRLRCIGCSQPPSPVHALTKGCPCGGQKYEALGPLNNYSGSRRPESRSISGYKVVEPALFITSQALPLQTTDDHSPVISATVLKLFGPEIEAMEAAAS
ncbi:hypothetical protein BKA70DRAFT_1280195 [Coprinopsis sp. MPI-PUGE-AT-0042]|nr:hypothetical protein BKA70DRAFT_1280195 [Coprinopsis sp. MPI-PUGE-AT-0042]